MITISYFDDLNPYLVREDEETTSITPSNPGYVDQTYLGNIMQLNVGKQGRFYFSYNGSEKWRDLSYTGIIEKAGRDFFIIKDPHSEKRYLLSYVYYLWADFDEELDYNYMPINQ